jgi:hypothetical protein
MAFTARIDTALRITFRRESLSAFIRVDRAGKGDEYEQAVGS